MNFVRRLYFPPKCFFNKSAEHGQKTASFQQDTASVNDVYDKLESLAVYVVGKRDHRLSGGISGQESYGAYTEIALICPVLLPGRSYQSVIGIPVHGELAAGEEADLDSLGFALMKYDYVLGCEELLVSGRIRSDLAKDRLIGQIAYVLGGILCLLLILITLLESRCEASLKVAVGLLESLILALQLLDLALLFFKLVRALFQTVLELRGRSLMIALLLEEEV